MGWNQKVEEYLNRNPRFRWVWDGTKASSSDTCFPATPGTSSVLGKLPDSSKLGWRGEGVSWGLGPRWESSSCIGARSHKPTWPAAQMLPDRWEFLDDLGNYFSSVLLKHFHASPLLWLCESMFISLFPHLWNLRIYVKQLYLVYLCLFSTWVQEYWYRSDVWKINEWMSCSPRSYLYSSSPNVACLLPCRGLKAL